MNTSGSEHTEGLLALRSHREVDALQNYNKTRRQRKTQTKKNQRKMLRFIHAPVLLTTYLFALKLHCKYFKARFYVSAFL